MVMDQAKDLGAAVVEGMAAGLTPTLDERAKRIRMALGASVELIIMAGQELAEARKEFIGNQGGWYNWLADEFDIRPRRARRYMALSRWLGRLIPEGIEPDKILAQPAALFRLTEGTVTDGARKEAIDEMLNGRFLSRAIVDGIIAGVERRTEQARYLETASDAIKELVAEHDPDPAVIPMLMRLEVQAPDVFQSIVSSGCIYDAQGEAIRLGEANERDMKDFIEHDRFEAQKQAWEEKRQAQGSKAVRLLIYSSGRIGLRAVFVNGDGEILREAKRTLAYKHDDVIPLEDLLGAWRNIDE